MKASESVQREGLVSTNQGTLRRTYAEDDIPRNASKASCSVPAKEHLGYLVDRRQIDIGVRTARLLEIISMGVCLCRRARNPLWFLQVLTGKLAHSLQIKRVLWSFLQDFFFPNLW